MRPSLKKHVLPILREIIGYNQAGMATQLRCSLSTIQSIESGRLGLSEKLAQKIEFETGVNIEWLLANDKRAPIIDWLGRPYTEQIFQMRQAEISKPKDSGDWIRYQMAAERALATIFSLIVRSFESGSVDLCLYRISKTVEGLAGDFGLSQADVEMDWKSVSGDPFQALAVQWREKITAALEKKSGKAPRHGDVSIIDSNMQSWPAKQKRTKRQ